MLSTSKSVVLVGFQDQGNLGLGYLAAVLINCGYNVQIVDIKQTPDDVLRCIRKHQPVLVGFSLIFQYFLSRYANLASFLRSKGVSCHITIGGHYPSLRCEQLMNQIPELDSVVLFEGELTLLELVEHLFKGQDWFNIRGIAYHKNGRVIKNPLRPLISNLDQLPFPYRPFEDKKTLGKKIQPILASRGCARNCAFCSIREFYGRALGKLVRRRSPINVVREMKALHEEENISIFLFQDDDFPLAGKAARYWIYDFIKELERQNLIGNIIWKISCRVDEVETRLFSDMKDAGLYLVYLGIESGTEEGLKTLNKQVTIQDNLRAVALLKELDLMLSYGFMLFDPQSTFDNVRANIRFLRKIIGDGSAAVVFCKMLPYSGTPIENELSASGRLRGSVVQPDYDFLNPALDEFYDKLNSALTNWVTGPDSVSHHLNIAWHEVAVIKRLFPKMMGLDKYVEFLRTSTQRINERIFLAIDETAMVFESEGIFPLSSVEMHKEACKLVETLLERRNLFIYHNQERMLAELAVDVA